MPGCHNGTADWEQMETADYQKSSTASVEVNELKKDLEGISQKVLTDSLRSMEADGIITRTVYPEVPPRVEYALSDLGETMRPILSSMEQWGANYKASIEQK